MRILLWSTNYYPYIGGIERLVHNLGCELIRQGHHVLVLTDAPRQNRVAHDNIDGVRIIRLPFTEALLTKHLPLIKETIQTVIEVITGFRADLVHIHGWYESMAFYQFRVAEKLSLPFFLTVHGLLEQDHYQTLACQRLWSICSSVSVVSHALREALEASEITHPDMRLIYNGSSMSLLPLSRHSGPIKTLVCVGRLSAEKGFDNAVQALKLLQPTYPGLQLVIAGGGPLFTNLSELVDALGLEQQVKLLDYVPPDQVDAIIDQGSIVLVPSSYESFGLVAVEASLRARPVIASNILGLQEVVADGETGLLVPPNDPHALAYALERLINAPEWASEMGLNGYHRSVKCFGLESMVNQYIDMYQEGRA